MKKFQSKTFSIVIDFIIRTISHTQNTNKRRLKVRLFLVKFIDFSLGLMIMKCRKVIHLQKSMTNQLVINYNSSIKWSIAQERLRQARLSFNLALAATAISFFISLMGGGLLLSGKNPSGTVTSAVGLISSAGCLKFGKDSNDRLDKILDELEDDD